MLNCAPIVSGGQTLPFWAPAYAETPTRTLLDVFERERTGSAQSDELLHRRLDPRAARVDLHVDVLDRPASPEVRREQLGPRRFRDHVQQPEAPIDAGRGRRESARGELRHAHAGFRGAARVHALLHAAAAAGRERFGARRGGAGEPDGACEAASASRSMTTPAATAAPSGPASAVLCQPRTEGSTPIARPTRFDIS